MEKRILTYQAETRSFIEKDKRYIEGMIPYNSESRAMTRKVGGLFTEVIEPSAFNKTIADKVDVKLLKEHDYNQMLARTKNGSLHIENRSDGLYFKAELNDSPLAVGTHEDIRSGLLDNVSFSFIPVKEDWESRSIKPSLRKLQEVKLLEISIVGEPAYQSSSVQARNYDELEKLTTKESLTNEDRVVIKKYINELENKIKEPEVKKETQEPVKTTPAAQYYNDLLKGL